MGGLPFTGLHVLEGNFKLKITSHIKNYFNMVHSMLNIYMIPNQSNQIHSFIFNKQIYWFIKSSAKTDSLIQNNQQKPYLFRRHFHNVADPF
jgi:hypothetical protein